MKKTAIYFTDEELAELSTACNDLAAYYAQNNFKNNEKFEKTNESAWAKISKERESRAS